LSTPEPGAEPLHQLVAQIERAGMREAVIFAIDMLRPIDVIGSQIVQFSRPFLAGSPWAAYAAVLAERESWQELRHLLTGRNEQ
jgi:hypothetical protein